MFKYSPERQQTSSPVCLCCLGLRPGLGLGLGPGCSGSMDSPLHPQHLLVKARRLHVQQKAEELQQPDKHARQCWLNLQVVRPADPEEEEEPGSEQSTPVWSQTSPVLTLTGLRSVAALGASMWSERASGRRVSGSELHPGSGGADRDRLLRPRPPNRT